MVIEDEDEDLAEFLEIESDDEILKVLENTNNIDKLSKNVNEDFIEFKDNNERTKILIVDKDKLDRIKNIFNLKDDEIKVINQRIIDELRHDIVVAVAKLYLFRLGYKIDDIESDMVNQEEFMKVVRICDDKLTKSKGLYDVLFGDKKNVISIISEIRNNSNSDITIRMKRKIKKRRLWG